nr:hypothetical protein [Tanacetum cinerariifolium]
ETKCTKDSKKGKIRLLILHQLIWGFVMTSVNKGSVLGVTSSSNSFCPEKHQGLEKYQHCPSSLNQSTVSSFDNAVLPWSPRNYFLVNNADMFVIFNQIFVDKFYAIIGTDESDSFVETDLKLLQKFNDDLWGFIFRSQKLNPSKIRIIINDD